MADGVFVSFVANLTIAACRAVSTDRSSASTPAARVSAAAAVRPSSEVSSFLRPAAWWPGQYEQRLQRDAATATISRSALESGESPFMHCM